MVTGPFSRKEAIYYLQMACAIASIEGKRGDGTPAPGLAGVASAVEAMTAVGISFPEIREAADMGERNEPSRWNILLGRETFE